MRLYNRRSADWLWVKSTMHETAMKKQVGPRANRKCVRYRESHQGVISWSNGLEGYGSGHDNVPVPGGVNENRAVAQAAQNQPRETRGATIPKKQRR